MSGETLYPQRIAEVINGIHSAPSVRRIILDMTPRVQELLGAERVTVYAIDTRNGELYSIFKEGADVSEIRIAKGYGSLAGYCALVQQTVTIVNAYDREELQKLHPRLHFNSKWDRATGFVTRSVLMAPIQYEGHGLGVLQLVNKVGGGPFSQEDVAAAEKIAETLGIAFFNRRRLAPGRRRNPFASLIDSGVLTEEKLEEAVAYARLNRKALADVLVEFSGIPKQTVLQSLEDFYSTPGFVFDGSRLMPYALKERLNYESLQKLRIAPLQIEDDRVLVAVEDPSDLEKVDMIRIMHIAPQAELRVALPGDIEAYLKASFAVEEGEEAFGEILPAENEAPEDEGDEIEDEGAIIRLVDQIMRDALDRGVTDIHVEPYGDEKPTIIRFRIDGTMSVYQEIPANMRRALVSRMKIMANLDISERRKPQDGKILFKTGGRRLELRVAVVPTAGKDEDVVLRLLASSEPLKLEEMGFSERNLRTFKALVQKPYGIFLCVGPTGSGKTTTLHSALGSINTPERKIWTAEDPIEITQAGLRQLQVQPKIGLTFAAAMRAFLRADPDVIMVGEMRDGETASTGVQASLTGHLVFSTLHTNSAAETVTRLLEMDIDALNFADSLLGILAQRLVKTLCPDCRRLEKPTDRELAEIISLYGEQYAVADGILDVPDLKVGRPVGCARCGGSGYRGRMAVHELLEATDAIRRLIREGATAEEVRVQAMKEGMRSLLQDGIAKVLQGKTELQKVTAVCLR